VRNAQIQYLFAFFLAAAVIPKLAGCVLVKVEIITEDDLIRLGLLESM
jgi:hypothetical protein